MTVKEMRDKLGLTQQKFGDRYKIPLRTIQSWEKGERIPPEYVTALLERVITEDAKKQ